MEVGVKGMQLQKCDISCEHLLPLQQETIYSHLRSSKVRRLDTIANWLIAKKKKKKKKSCENKIDTTK